MLLRAIRDKIRNTKKRATKEAARVACYLTCLESVTEWLGTESNRRHADFQSAALPTELPSREPHKLTAPHTSFNPFRSQRLSNHPPTEAGAKQAKQTLRHRRVSISSPLLKI